MFTGIVEEIGQVRSLRECGDSIVLSLDCQRVIEDAQRGDSIAVSGVCLTIVDFDATGFSADVMKESLDRSSLGDLKVGSPVNLERALAVGDRLGGHTVQGHVDCTSTLISRTPGERWEVFRFELPKKYLPYVVEKGSIAIDGTSLTISALGEDFFEVSLIPTTLKDTTLGGFTPGDRVNLEFDVVGKYILRALHLGLVSPEYSEDTDPSGPLVGESD